MLKLKRSAAVVLVQYFYLLSDITVGQIKGGFALPQRILDDMKTYINDDTTSAKLHLRSRNAARSNTYSIAGNRGPGPVCTHSRLELS